MKTHNRHLKIVEWSDEDKIYVGTCPELFFGGCHGANKKKVYKLLCAIVADVVELENNHGEPPVDSEVKEDEGDYSIFTHPTGVTAVISGDLDDDAFNYQLKQLKLAKQAVKKITSRGKSRRLPRRKISTILEKKALAKAFGSAQKQSVSKRTNALKMEEINAEIAACRRQKDKRK